MPKLIEQIPYALIAFGRFRQMAPARPKVWLAAPEAAHAIGVSVDLLDKLCAQNPPAIPFKREGTRGRGGKGTRLFHVDDLAEYNARKKRGALPETTTPKQAQPRRRAYVPKFLK